MKMEKKNDQLSLSFNDNLPSVTVKKIFIPVNVKVEGIVLKENEGSIRLKYFPDLTFTYEDGIKFSEPRFGSQAFDMTDFKEEIKKEFPDSQRRRIAETALKYANEWVNIANESGINFSQCNPNKKKKMYDDCNKFVHENMMKSKEIEAKSAVLSFILIYFVLPAVISWIVKKLLDRTFT